MLYLLLPDRTMKWVDLPAQSIYKLAKENQADMANLPWDALDRRADDITLRLCLRRGHTCSAGIVVGGEELAVMQTPQNILKAQAASKDAHKALDASPTAELLERLMPGNAKEKQRLNAEADTATAQALDNAVAELEGALAAEPHPDLVEHWRHLGGTLPSPA